MTLILDIRDIRNSCRVREALKPAIEILKEGGIAIYPTDTVYGIGCNPLDEDAIKRLLKLKGRSDKPLPLLASSVEIVERIAVVTREAKKLIERFWPGPLTLVLPLKTGFSHQITLSRPKIGVRVPRSEVARILAEGLGGLIIGTSANRSGERAPRNFEEAYSWVEGKVEVAINGGYCVLGVSSSVVEINGEVKVLREEALKANEILGVIGGER
ncbi:MAG: L-threonylcarbamoyladenylate synthase [Candidatus Nezhaarchaeota archaeon]|nr:L-threonylcarbamoyladenylate synthase [Candidatus Nezhaarchaeota archaeon]